MLFEGLALDLSNYGGELDGVTVRKWWDLGIRKVIVGVGRDWALASRQLRAAVAGGMEVEVYVFLYYDEDPKLRLDWVSLAIEGLPVKFMWLDFEDGDTLPGGYSWQSLVVLWIHECMNTAAARWGSGMIGLYTGAWWWRPNTNDTTDFSCWPLWVADYDGVANLEFDRFGGWDACRMKQFKGTTDVSGYSVDLNYFREESEDMDKATEAKLTKAALVARWSGLILTGEPRLVALAVREMLYVRTLCNLPAMPADAELPGALS